MRPLVIFNNRLDAPDAVDQGPLGDGGNPDGTQVINYHFKFDYEYNAIRMRSADSKPPPFQLQIVDSKHRQHVDGVGGVDFQNATR